MLVDSVATVRLGPIFVDTAAPGLAAHQHGSRCLGRLHVHIVVPGPAARLDCALVDSTAPGAAAGLGRIWVDTAVLGPVARLCRVLVDSAMPDPAARLGRVRMDTTALGPAAHQQGSRRLDRAQLDVSSGYAAAVARPATHLQKPVLAFLEISRYLAKLLVWARFLWALSHLTWLLAWPWHELSLWSKVGLPTFRGPALHCAVESGNEAVVRLLINEGADVLATDKKGSTPLHRAAEVGTRRQCGCSSAGAPTSRPLTMKGRRRCTTPPTDGMETRRRSGCSWPGCSSTRAPTPRLSTTKGLHYCTVLRVGIKRWRGRGATVN